MRRRPSSREGVPWRSIDLSPMSLLWSIVILIAVNVATIAAMLLVRRRAPEGSRFTDGDRASEGVLKWSFLLSFG
jgi:hypothetical protein